MRQRKQGTTTYPALIYLVLSTDHVTAATGKAPAAVLSKNGAAFGAALGTVSEIGNGWYALAGNATDRDTLGPLAIHVTAAGCDPYDAEYVVVPHDPFDLTTLDDPMLAAVGDVLDAVTDLQDLTAAEVQAAAVLALEEYDAATGDDVEGIEVDLQPLVDAIEALNDVSVADLWAGLSIEAANRIADHVLRRKQAEVQVSADGDTIDDAASLFGIGQQHRYANTVDNPGFLTVYAPDGAELEQIPVSAGSAMPIRGVGSGS